MEDRGGLLWNRNSRFPIPISGWPQPAARFGNNPTRNSLHHIPQSPVLLRSQGKSRIV